MSLNNSEFPRQFTISSATSHFCSMCAETKLNPPHGFNELCLPLFDPLKREFFATCAEHDDFHRATSEREQVHLLFQWSQMQSITRISLQDIADFFGVNNDVTAEMGKAMAAICAVLAVLYTAVSVPTRNLHSKIDTALNSKLKKKVAV